MKSIQTCATVVETVVGFTAMPAVVKVSILIAVAFSIAVVLGFANSYREYQLTEE